MASGAFKLHESYPAKGKVPEDGLKARDYVTEGSAPYQRLAKVSAGQSLSVGGVVEKIKYEFKHAGERAQQAPTRTRALRFLRRCANHCNRSRRATRLLGAIEEPAAGWGTDT